MEMDGALGDLIVEVFADFEQFLPSPQDVHLYRRKVKEYVDRIQVRLSETADPTQTREQMEGGANGTDE
jgi:hypothetical protein